MTQSRMDQLGRLCVDQFRAIVDSTGVGVGVGVSVSVGGGVTVGVAVVVGVGVLVGGVGVRIGPQDEIPGQGPSSKTRTRPLGKLGSQSAVIRPSMHSKIISDTSLFQ